MMKEAGVLERPGVRIRFSDSGGDARPVVFIHGAGMDHTMFSAQAVAVREAGYRPILWDLRGHGESTIDAAVRFTASDALRDLEALLQKCAVAAPILVGHSLGGNLAQAFVREHPTRAAGLIVVDATWNAGALSSLERLGMRLAAPMLGAIPAARLPRLMAAASAVRPEAVAEIERVFARMPKRRFLDVWRATVSFVKPDPTYRSPVPIGLLRGAEDRTGNIASAMPRWAEAEGVRERVVPDAGHVVTLDEPDVASAALLSLLAEMTP